MAADAPPASAYVTTEKTVTDTVTGLVWQRIDGVSGASWDDAQSYCQSLTLEGQGGWRLPTLIELESLVDYSRSNPAIEPAAFPRTPAMDHWTSTMLYLPGEATNVWTVRFNAGATGATAWDFPTEAHAARCVRCACASARPQLAQSPPAGRFVASAATVADKVTGLTWERQNGGETPLSLSWDGAKTYCATLVLDGQSGWRLPTVKELQSLVDVRSRQPALDPAIFPGVGELWASSGIVNDPTLAWTVAFEQGQTVPTVVTVKDHVRCVR